MCVISKTKRRTSAFAEVLLIIKYIRGENMQFACDIRGENMQFACDIRGENMQKCK